METSPLGQPRPKCKILIRKFPTGYTSEQFFKLIQPWSDVIGYKNFVPGKKPRPLSGKPIINGRAYLDFGDNSAALLDAAERLNGMRLVDSNGYEGFLEVGLALFQRLPPDREEKDPLEATIESCPEYQKFMAELEATQASHATAIPLDKQFETMLEKEKELNPWKYNRELHKQTPLLIHLKSQALKDIDLKSFNTTGLM